MADLQPDSETKAATRRAVNSNLDGIASSIFNELRDEWKCVYCKDFPENGEKSFKGIVDPVYLYVLHCGHYICWNCRDKVRGQQTSIFDNTVDGEEQKSICKDKSATDHFDRKCQLIEKGPEYKNEYSFANLPPARHISDIMNLLRICGIECKSCTDKLPRATVSEPPVKPAPRGGSSCLLKFFNILTNCDIAQEEDSKKSVEVKVEPKACYHRDDMAIYTGKLEEGAANELKELLEQGHGEDAKIADLINKYPEVKETICGFCAKEKYVAEKIKVLSMAKFPGLCHGLDDMRKLDFTELCERSPRFLMGIGRQDMLDIVIKQLLNCKECEQMFDASNFLPSSLRLPAFLDCGHIVCDDCERSKQAKRVENRKCESCYIMCTNCEVKNITRECNRCDLKKKKDDPEVEIVPPRFPPQDVMKVLLVYNSAKGGARLLTVYDYPECGACGRRLPEKHMIQSNSGGKPTCTFCYFDYPKLKKSQS